MVTPQQEFDNAKKSAQSVHPGAADHFVTFETAAGIFTFFTQAHYQWFEELPTGYLSPVDQKTGLAKRLLFHTAGGRRGTGVDLTVVVRQVLNWLEEQFKEPSFIEAFGELNWMSEPTGGREPQEKLLTEFLTFGAARRRAPGAPIGNMIGSLAGTSDAQGKVIGEAINPIHFRCANGVTFETSSAELRFGFGHYTGTVELLGQTQFFTIKSPIVKLSEVMHPLDVVREVTYRLGRAYPFLKKDLVSTTWKFDNGAIVLGTEEHLKQPQ
jgi:hypothetical protein